MGKQNSKKSNNVRRTLHYYWEITKKYSGYNLFVFFATIAVVLLRSIFITYIVSDIINDLQSGGTTDEIAGRVIFKGILAISLHIISEILGEARMICNWKSELYAMYDLYNKAFDTVCFQSMQFHVDRFSGSLVTQVNRFVRAYERLMDVIVWSALPFIVSVISILIVIGFRMPLFALGLLVFVSIYIAISVATSKKFNVLNEEIANAESKATGQLADAISNITDRKSVV